MDKASPGSPFHVPPAGIWNGMVAAGIAYSGESELGSTDPQRARPRDTNRLDLRNDSGAALVRGSVLQIGDKITTAPTPEALWFEGIEVADVAESFAITRYPCSSAAEMVECQAAGIILARVNILVNTHRFADVVVGDTVLSSAASGRCKIIWPESGGSTGEQDAVVQIGAGSTGASRIYGKLDANLTNGSTGTLSIWAGGADTTQNETVRNRTGVTLLSGILMEAEPGRLEPEFLVQPHEMEACP